MPDDTPQDAAPAPCPPHRARGYRNPAGIEVGALCLSCGLIVARTSTVTDDELRTLALRFLDDETDGRIVLGRKARRSLQSDRRRLNRKATR